MKNFRKITSVTLSILLLNIANSFSQNYNTFNVKIHKQSSIDIEGTSNVNSFVFHQQGPFVQYPIQVSFAGNPKKELVKPVSIPIEVKNFDCENKLMKSDFFNTLNIEKYPILTITVTKVELPPNFNVNSNYTSTGSVRVSIHLAGAISEYKIPFFTTTKGDKIIIFGEKNVNFSDFNLTPPSKLFGAIKVHNNLLIKVNLVVSYSDVEQENG
jgi:hypothetical protein